MAAPDGALQAQLASWFASIDPTMQQVLKDIYAEAPAAVSKAISFGASQLSVLTSAPDWNTAHSMMPDALNYLASIENLEGSESGMISTLSDRVAQADSNIIAVGVPNIAELLTDIGAAASQASTQEHVTPEVRKPLFDALTALNEALGQALAGAEA